MGSLRRSYKLLQCEPVHQPKPPPPTTSFQQAELLRSSRISTADRRRTWSVSPKNKNRTLPKTDGDRLSHKSTRPPRVTPHTCHNSFSFCEEFLCRPTCLLSSLDTPHSLLPSDRGRWRSKAKGTLAILQLEKISLSTHTMPTSRASPASLCRGTLFATAACLLANGLVRLLLCRACRSSCIVSAAGPQHTC